MQRSWDKIHQGHRLAVLAVPGSRDPQKLAIEVGEQSCLLEGAIEADECDHLVGDTDLLSRREGADAARHWSGAVRDLSD